MSESSYYAAAADTEPEAARLALMESIYDPGTVEMLRATRVGPGWRCLVPGAGHGSIARWLAEQVGPDGHVVATDIDTRFLQECASDHLEVRHHDLLNDPVESEGYDLACVRYLLEHLSGHQRQAIDRLVSVLRVGGWLAIDQSDPVVMASVHDEQGDDRGFDDTAQALFQAASEHIDVRAGRHIVALLAKHPQLRVEDLDIRTRIESGGSPHSRSVVESGKLALRGLVRAGAVAQGDVDRWAEALCDSQFLYIAELRYRMLAQRTSATV